MLNFQPRGFCVRIPSKIIISPKLPGGVLGTKQTWNRLQLQPRLSTTTVAFVFTTVTIQTNSCKNLTPVLSVRKLVVFWPTYGMTRKLACWDSCWLSLALASRILWSRTMANSVFHFSITRIRIISHSLCPTDSKYFNGSCYSYIYDHLTAVDRHSRCAREYGSHPYSIHSHDEQWFTLIAVSRSNCFDSFYCILL